MKPGGRLTFGIFVISEMLPAVLPDVFIVADFHLYINTLFESGVPIYKEDQSLHQVGDQVITCARNLILADFMYLKDVAQDPIVRRRRCHNGRKRLHITRV